MDGQFHTVEFDPSSTAAEVLNLVINKIGLRNADIAFMLLLLFTM